MALSSYLPMLVFPSGSALLGFSVGVERLVYLALIAFCVGLVYHFRWLATTQQPLDRAQMWGYVTIPQGEKWNVRFTSGKLETVDGPRVVFVWGATLLQLVSASATHAQYLVVEFVDGRSEIIAGPAQIYKDRIIHKDIKVKDAVNLTDSEVLVVYRDDSTELPTDDKSSGGAKKVDQAVSRHVITGPCVHVPKNATEWTHQFCWHGSLQSEPWARRYGRADEQERAISSRVPTTRETSNDQDAIERKVKNALKFTKLRVCPEQTYFDVEGVRTKDDALVTVKVMIFYRLKDIDTMLRETHDPIADFINSITSDVIEFVSGNSFEDFKAASDQLNDLGVYQQLTSRAKGIGFEVTKVVFRGYGAPPRLQKMHDDAIERRTKLTLERENEDQEQKMLDMKLEHEQERQQKKRQMEVEAKEHERKLQRAAHEAKQKELMEERQAQLEHLGSLKSTVGMSSEQLAAYLVSSEQGPPSKLVQIVGKVGGDSGHSSFVIQDSA